MGVQDELQAWTRQGGHQVNAKAAVPHAFFFLPCVTCPERIAIPAMIGPSVSCPILKNPPPVYKQNCIDEWESNEQGTAETGEGTVLMSYLTAQYTKITYFTNENENVSSRGIGCRGNKWKICCPVAAATK